MALARYLIDKSARARLNDTEVAKAITPLVRGGRAATSGMVALEMLYSARNVHDHDRIRANLFAYEWLRTEDEDFLRAIEVQRELARTGRHRAARLPDLLIAATAERHEMTVLHYDGDFELIAEVTGQPIRWVVPRGSVP